MRHRLAEQDTKNEDLTPSPALPPGPLPRAPVVTPRPCLCRAAIPEAHSAGVTDNLSYANICVLDGGTYLVVLFAVPENIHCPHH